MHAEGSIHDSGFVREECLVSVGNPGTESYLVMRLELMGDQVISTISHPPMITLPLKNYHFSSPVNAILIF